MAGCCPSPSARSPPLRATSIAWAKSRKRNDLRIFVASSSRFHPWIYRSIDSASSRDIGETAPRQGSHFLDASPMAPSLSRLRAEIPALSFFRIATPEGRAYPPRRNSFPPLHRQGRRIPLPRRGGVGNNE